MLDSPLSATSVNSFEYAAYEDVMEFVTGIKFCEPCNHEKPKHCRTANQRISQLPVFHKNYLLGDPFQPVIPAMKAGKTELEGSTSLTVPAREL